MKARLDQLCPQCEYEAGPITANCRVLLEPKSLLKFLMVVSRRFGAALVEAGRCPSAEARVASPASSCQAHSLKLNINFCALASLIERSSIFTSYIHSNKSFHLSFFYFLPFLPILFL